MDGTCTTVRAVRGKTAHGPGAAEKKRTRAVRSAALSTEGLRRLAAGEYDDACLPLRSAPYSPAHTSPCFPQPPPRSLAYPSGALTL